MVAKTYQSLEIQGEPFEENKRLYVNVITTKGLKKARWYSDVEYRRMYPDDIIEKNNTMDFNARQAFGFGEKGYITLYKGQNVKEWAENDRTNIWYNLTFGYYTPSKFPTPKVSDGIEPVQLKWEEVQDYEDRMKPHEEVAKFVNNLISIRPNKNNSTYQGQENEWLEKEVSIKENITHEGHYGEKHTHYMCDAEDNMYIWETGAKNLETGMVVKLRMKVKEHKEIKGEKCTIVWYCKEI